MISAVLLQFFSISVSAETVGLCSKKYEVSKAAERIKYKEADSDNRLDIYAPASAPRPYKPILFYTASCFLEDDHAIEKTYVHRLVALGYAVIVADYRKVNLKTKKNYYPAALEDAQGAYCWIQKNGKSYGLKTDDIVAMGVGTGGTLAAYLGEDHKVEGKSAPCEIRPSAVIEIAGRMNFLKKTEHPERPDCAEYFVGARRDPKTPQPIFHKADVIENLNPELAAPTLVIHGKRDQLVSVQHARKYCNALKSKCTFVELVNAGHELDGPGELETAFDRICVFLHEREENRLVQDTKPVELQKPREPANFPTSNFDGRSKN